MPEFKLKTERQYTNISTVIQEGEGVGFWVIIFGSLIFYVANFFSMSIYHFNHLQNCLNTERHPK